MPMVVFAKGAHYALKDLSELDYDVIQVDWTVDLAAARDIIGPNKTLQVLFVFGASVCVCVCVCVCERERER